MAAARLGWRGRRQRDRRGDGEDSGCGEPAARTTRRRVRCVPAPSPFATFAGTDCTAACPPKGVGSVPRAFSRGGGGEVKGYRRICLPFQSIIATHASHETIYRSLFVQARGVLKKDLQAHLRSGRAIRRSRHATSKGGGRGSIADAISIRERPASVEDRAVPGHWEGDLICGSSNSYVVTLVERHSRSRHAWRSSGRDARQ